MSGAGWGRAGCWAGGKRESGSRAGLLAPGELGQSGLDRTGCLGHAVGVLGGPLSEGEEMGWAEVWQLGPG